MNTIKNTTQIYVPSHNEDGWFAELSDGSDWRQYGESGDISQWYAMKAKCDKEHIGILKLGMRCNGVTVVLEDADNVYGWWQAQRMWVGDKDASYQADPNSHWRGIGFVNAIMIAECTWVAHPAALYARDVPGVSIVFHPHTQQPVVWKQYENRVAITETQIIWKPGVTPSPPLA